ncbi:MAG TPA: nickel-dependent hydrogenase large subunit [Methanocellaceae archaeon]
MKITIDPFTRLSSGLRVSVEIKDGSVIQSSVSGTSYRGLEQMLTGRDPFDAPYFTQRVCGMCPTSHATAACEAIEKACGVAGSIPKDALVIRNMLNALTWLRSHIEHLYLGFLPDLADPTYRDTLKGSDHGVRLWAELSGRYTTYTGTAYLDAIRCMRLISQAEAILGGRSPGSPAIVPGGVTSRPTRTDLNNLNVCVSGIQAFLQQRLLGDENAEDWLAGSHDGTQEFLWKYLGGLSVSDLSSWGDMQLFLVFCSRMVSKELMQMPAYIELDTIGGYPMDDLLIGFLSYGAFYRLKDAAGNYRDGYASSDDGRTTGYEIPAGFTPGSMQNIGSLADRLDSTLIAEQVYGSFYDYPGTVASLSPSEGITAPLSNDTLIDFADTKYSFIKAPRYGRVPCETGPLSRMVNSREKLTLDLMQKLYGSNPRTSVTYPMASVYTRIAARMQEMLLLARMLQGWAGDLEISENGRKYSVPIEMEPSKSGAGLLEAPRGALGHWMSVNSAGKIDNYQIISPTTWNASPRGSDLKLGPMELALLGGKMMPSGYIPGSENNPLAIYHVVRSFDPCVSCAVHTIRKR